MKQTKKQMFIKFIIELLLMSILYYWMNSAGTIKYILAMGLSGLFLFLGRKNKWSSEALIIVALPAVVYTLIGSINALLNTCIPTATIKEMIYWLVPVVIAFALYTYYGEDMERIVDIQFLASIVVYFRVYYWSIFRYWKMESVFAFVFGAFVIYYLYKKKWIMSILAAVLTYMCVKKIAFLAVAGSLVIMGIVFLSKKSRAVVLTLWAMLGSGIFYYLYLLDSGVLKNVLYYFGNYANGRFTMYDRFREMYDVSVLYFGRGLGYVVDILESWNIPTYGNLHNDLLKFYIELGFWGMLLFLISYGVIFYMTEKKFDASKMCLLFVMSIYSIILFMTDNVSIYMLYLVPVYSIFFAVLASENESKKGKTYVKKDNS